MPVPLRPGPFPQTKWLGDSESPATGQGVSVIFLGQPEEIDAAQPVTPAKVVALGTADNEIVNPSAEALISGFTGSATPVRITSDSYIGSACAEVDDVSAGTTISIGASFHSGTNSYPPGDGRLVTVVPGDTLFARAAFKYASGDQPTQITLRIRWSDASGAFLSYSILQTIATPAAGTWYERSGSASAPASAAYASVFIIASGASGFAAVVRADQVMVVRNPPIASVDYFDGDNGGSWFDTANASRSRGSALLAETNTAQTTRPAKVGHVGQAAETDLAQPVTPARRAAVAQATETDTAQPIRVAKVAQVGQVTETSLAQPIAAAKRATAGQASEAGTAQLVTARKIVAVAQASESDSAQTIAPARAIPVGEAIETDVAQTTAPHKTAGVGAADETDTAAIVASTKIAHVGQSPDSDQAQPVTPARTHAIGRATEAETARAVTVAKTVTETVAIEVQTARAITVSRTHTIGQAAEADSAGTAGVGQRLIVGLATDTSTVAAIRIVRTLTVGRAIDLAAAQAVHLVRVLTLGRAVETNTATGVVVPRIGHRLGGSVIYTIGIGGVRAAAIPAVRTPRAVVGITRVPGRQER